MSTLVITPQDRHAANTTSSTKQTNNQGILPTKKKKNKKQKRQCNLPCHQALSPLTSTAYPASFCLNALASINSLIQSILSSPVLTAK